MSFCSKLTCRTILPTTQIFFLVLTSMLSCKSGTKFSDTAQPRPGAVPKTPLVPSGDLKQPQSLGPENPEIKVPVRVLSTEDASSVDSPADRGLSFVSIPPTEHRIDIPEGDSLRLPVVVRDFSDKHPDFESYLTNKVTKGLVAKTLDEQGKPRFVGKPGFTITNAKTFAQWYRRVKGVNKELVTEIELKRVGKTDIFAHHSASFFPIDDRGFGNEGRVHNYHYTVEIESEFTYQGTEKFTFKGDDDIWVFIDGRLAVDLGGTHQEATQSVELSSLGLIKGKRYPFKFFYAERHTSLANFNLETSILLNASKPYIYRPTLRGVGEANIQFQLKEAPEGMSIDPKGGLITWRADIADLGVHRVEIVAIASDRREASQEFSIHVVKS